MSTPDLVIVPPHDPAELGARLEPYSDGRIWNERLVLTEIHAYTETIVQSAYEIGRRLIWAKEVMGHGMFVEWCEKSLPFGGRTARNYMQVASFLLDHPALLQPLNKAGLKKTLLLTTLPPGTLEELVGDGQVAEISLEGIADIPYIELKKQVDALKTKRIELEDRLADTESQLEDARNAVADQAIQVSKIDEHAERVINQQWAKFEGFVTDLEGALLVLVARWDDIHPSLRARVVGMVEGVRVHTEHAQLVLKNNIGEAMWGEEYGRCLREAAQVGLPINDDRKLPFYD